MQVQMAVQMAVLWLWRNVEIVLVGQLVAAAAGRL